MKIELDEKNYKHLVQKLIDSHPKEQTKRGALMHDRLSFNEKKKDSRPFIILYSILNCIPELKPIEKMVYAILLNEAKLERNRLKDKNVELREVEFNAPTKEFEMYLGVSNPTMRTYYNHLEEIGMIKTKRNAKNVVESIVCLFDPEIFSKEEMFAIINYLSENDGAFNYGNVLYEALDARLGIDSKQQVELLKKQKEKGKVVKLKKKEAEKKETEDKEKKKEVDDTYDEFGDFKF